MIQKLFRNAVSAGHIKFIMHGSLYYLLFNPKLSKYEMISVASGLPLDESKFVMSTATGLLTWDSYTFRLVKVEEGEPLTTKETIRIGSDIYQKYSEGLIKGLAIDGIIYEPVDEHVLSAISSGISKIICFIDFDINADGTLVYKGQPVEVI